MTDERVKGKAVPQDERRPKPSPAPKDLKESSCPTYPLTEADGQACPRPASPPKRTSHQEDFASHPAKETRRPPDQEQTAKLR